MTGQIPLFDCRVSSSALQDLAGVFASGQLSAGPAVHKLERAFVNYFPDYEAVAVGDMTHALLLALQLCGAGIGDEVLTLSFNCMSSNSAISMTGARPIWVDVDPESAAFDVEHARTLVTKRTKAVVVYHVSGYPADIAAVKAFTDEVGVPLIEDANNAFMAELGGRPIGSWGDYVILSFYANRQVNAIDGGMLLCRQTDDASRARRLRRFGIDVTRFRDADGEIDPAADVPEIGLSSTLNNVNATLALVGLADVKQRVERSRQNAAILTSTLRGTLVRPVTPTAEAKPAYWTWLVRLDARDAVMRSLKARGVLVSKLHSANHRYSGFRSPADLPGTSVLEREMLAIPCGWWIDPTTAERIGVMVGEAARDAQ